jgi:hypothetical protein
VNDISWAKVVVRAVSDRVGQAAFADDVASDMCGLSRVRSSRPSHERIVECTTLDDTAARFRNPDVLKIDIEGAELLALRGADRLLREVRPTILVELHSDELYDSFLTLMSGYNYRLMDLSEEPLRQGNYTRFVLAKPTEASNAET